MAKTTNSKTASSPPIYKKEQNTTQ